MPKQLCSTQKFLSHCKATVCVVHEALAMAILMLAVLFHLALLQYVHHILCICGLTWSLE